MVTLLGVQWHGYGLLLGVSIWLAWELMVRQARRKQIPWIFSQLEVFEIIIGGVVGARVYHVLTDWPLYVDRPWEAVYIWQGGLSVIGAVLGGALVLVWIVKRQGQLRKLPVFLDLSVFGLPFAQALGRLGNYFNQELYGQPSTLPWAITIETAHRLPGYRMVATYHPLFAYEGLAMLVFGMVIWWWDRRRPFKLGNGRLFASYVAYYAMIRFLLDYLRLDARPLGILDLTLNQGVMLIVLFGAIVFLGKKQWYAKR